MHAIKEGSLRKAYTKNFCKSMELMLKMWVLFKRPSQPPFLRIFPFYAFSLIKGEKLVNLQGKGPTHRISHDAFSDLIELERKKK